MTPPRTSEVEGLKAELRYESESIGVNGTEFETRVAKLLGRAADTLSALLAENVELRALADYARLLGPAREVLDRCADRRPGSAEEAERMAQQIVDLIGHPVTDEPPHALVRLREAEATLEKVRAAIPDGSPIPHRAVAETPCLACRILGILTTPPPTETPVATEGEET